MMRTIRGQLRAVTMLREQLAAGRVHHAYIFHGPAGVGKFTTALAFARVLLSSDSDAHPDLHVVTKELAAFSDDATVRSRKLRNIPVDVVRSALIEPVHRAASTPGGRKVFIVDEAELLDPTGQNAMLKTLEEPPRGTVVILITTSERRLLPTVRSRCQRIAFARLDDAVIGDWLAERGIAEADRPAVVTFAQGSLGRAQLAMDYQLTAWVNRVLPGIDRLARGEPDPMLGGDIHQFVDAFAAAWVERHKTQNASKEAANQLGANLMHAMIADHAAARLGDPADDPHAWLSVIDAVERSRSLLASNLNASLVADGLAAQLGASFAAAAARD